MRATEHCYTVTDEQTLNGEPVIKGTRKMPLSRGERPCPYHDLRTLPRAELNKW
jgi:hypothetical protein